MRFKQWLSLGVRLLVLFPQLVFAVGLGEITVYSTLNQALDAEIQILNMTPGALPRDLIPEIASQQEFESMHMARPFWLTRIEFQIEKKPDESYTIRLRSGAPIREPIVNFLLKLKTPDGASLLKEYLFFLDLPDMTEAQNQLEFKQEVLGAFNDKAIAVKRTVPVEEKQPSKDSSLLINDLDKPIEKTSADSVPAEAVSAAVVPSAQPEATVLPETIPTALAPSPAPEQPPAAAVSPVPETMPVSVQLPTSEIADEVDTVSESVMIPQEAAITEPEQISPTVSEPLEKAVTKEAIAPSKVLEPNAQSKMRLVLGGGAVLLLLPALFFWRRSRAKKAQAEDFLLEQTDPMQADRLSETLEEMKPLSADSPSVDTLSVDLDPLALAQQYVEEASFEQAEYILQKALLADPDDMAIIKKLIEIYATNEKPDNIAALVSRIPASVRQQDPKAWMFIHSICRTFGIPCDKPEEVILKEADAPEEDAISEIPTMMVEEAPAVPEVEEVSAVPEVEEVSAVPVVEEVPVMRVEEVSAEPVTPVVEDIPVVVLEEEPTLSATTVEIEGLKLADWGAVVSAQSEIKKQVTPESDFSSLRLVDPEVANIQPASDVSPSKVQELSSNLTLTTVDTNEEALVNEIIFEPVVEPEEAPQPQEEATQDYIAPDDLQAKLELAKRYIDMGEVEDARELLTELVVQGDSEQRRIALELIEQL